MRPQPPVAALEPSVQQRAHHCLLVCKVLHHRALGALVRKHRRASTWSRAGPVNQHEKKEGNKKNPRNFLLSALIALLTTYDGPQIFDHKGDERSEAFLVGIGGVALESS